MDTRINGEDSSPFSSAQFSVVAASVIAAILLIVIATYVREPSDPVPVLEIRIRNDSHLDFQDVVVGRGHYGDLGKGQTSSYLTWGPAYRYAYVALRAGEKVFRVVPEDYVGEVPLVPVNLRLP